MCGQLRPDLVNHVLNSVTPPPENILLPYTTLFRTRRRRDRARRHGARDGTRIARTPGSPGGGRAPLRDRKSTRLNSSHVSTSYAVFCLKKKRERSAMVHCIPASRSTAFRYGQAKRS